MVTFLPPAGVLGSVVEIRPGEDFVHFGIDPERLYLDDSSLSWQAPGWGLYAGVVCLVLLSAALLVSDEAGPGAAGPPAE